MLNFDVFDNTTDLKYDERGSKGEALQLLQIKIIVYLMYVEVKWLTKEEKPITTRIDAQSRVHTVRLKTI